MEFYVEIGTETGRLCMQLRQMGFRDSVLPAHLADHELRIATDQICVGRPSILFEFVEMSK